MKGHLHFRIIGLLVTVALAGIIAFQGFWLNGLYDTLYSRMDTGIREAMRLADYKELFFRMQELKEKNEKGERFSRTIPFGNPAGEDEPGGDDDNFIRNDVNINLQDTDLNTQVEEVLSELLHTLGNMEDIILQGMHDEVDPLIAVNYHRYDSLLASELKAQHVDARYRLFLARDSIGERTIVQSLGKNHPVPEAPEQMKESIHYDYPSVLNRHADPSYYRLYIKTPARIVLHQMLGILASSFLLLVIIGAAFVYLLRTIMRQKTEKELKEDFTNNMTHELKTPVSVSYAAVDSLLHFGGTIDDRQRKYLTIVQEQLTRLTGLVEQILTLSVENRSTFRLRLEPVALSAFIGRLIEQYRVNASQNVRFTVDIPDDITVTADKIHLHNIFNNLIDNAIKYADRDTVDVSLKAEADGRGIRIRVGDNGAGISPAHQARIFDKFYRIPDGNRHNVKGHGLGLYYVKDMMTKHEGNVSVESTPGRGTTFHLTFKG